jgi:hypothetical protein
MSDVEKSANVIDIQANKPHVVIDGLGGGQHVIPVEFFTDVRLGLKSLKDLDAFESIAPIIVNEWLISKGI